MPSLSEADTCRKFVVPKLQAVGWDDDPHSIAEQRTITDGRIVPVGKGFVRKPPMRADFLLRYTRDFPLAVVEAKAAYKSAADGLQQPRRAPRCGLLFAYATNGHEIIELADRNILVDDPKDKDFAYFGDARCKIGDDPFSLGREMYFATYQALAEDERRDGLFKAFPPDFFDLVIVDECHRGSARDDSSWRAILDYFKPAYQLGMTATPLRDDNRDTYLYFGNPIYQYSLRQGIEDGFLAPYRVHRVITEWDAAGWRPSIHELDRKNPRSREDITHLPPDKLAESIMEKEKRITEIMGNIRNLLAHHGT